MPKVSVIVPVYNVEKYIAKCLNCLLNQELKEIEIICVDDCSTDESLCIIRDMCKKDKRIKVIEKERNEGLSCARNTGIKVATGEYLYFIDPDDWIDTDYLKKMYNVAIKYDLDVVLNTNILSVVEQTGEIKHFYPSVTPTDINHCFVDSKKAISNLLWSACIHLWKKSFLEKHNLLFPEGYTNEDEYFQAISYMYLNKLYVIRDSKYYYLQRSDSICADLQKKNKNLLSHLRIYEKICDEYTKRFPGQKFNFRFLINMFFDINFCENKEDVYKKLKLFIDKRIDFFEQNKNVYTKLELEFIDDVLKDNKSKLFSAYYRGKYACSVLKKKREQNNA